ncbi:MAG TPA: 50S ribosomal protein L29 [Candidatus Nanoarchaeia archaeon]|nr:50S ribosomal protein L29 [Candidatus Nanoarchaeia archaeon]
MKKVKELITLDDNALKARIVELRKELMKYSAQVAIGTVPKNPSAIRNIKRSIARILTLLNERRLKAKV